MKKKSVSPRPNIIFVMVDDQGPWAYGAAGDPNARTPTLDRLCQEGARLTNYFTMSPVCSPARGCLVTGLYSTEFGIPDYISPQMRAQGVALDPKFATWPRCLMEAGYTTALVGKWHLGSPPTRHGYQEFVGGLLHISKDPLVEIGGVSRRIEGYTADVTTDFAIDFIQRAKRKGEEPFLLSLHYFAPHANTANRTPDGDRTWLPLSEADWSQFEDLDPIIPNPDYPDLDIPRLKRMTREYLASIASVDRNLGRLLDELERLDLDQNTLIVFTSDNGYNMGHNGIWHKGNGWWILIHNRGARPNLYDNSLRVPCIVRWPGIIPAGLVINETLTHLDWFPTLIEIAGASIPEGTTLRGRNMLPILRGESVEWDNDLFTQYSMWEWHQNGAKLRSFRTPKWKLIRDFRHEGKDELYHLEEDPAETTNLINSSDPAVQEMREWLNEKLLERMHSINDPLLA